MAKPKRPRRHISLTTKLAAMMLMVPQRDEFGRPKVDGMGNFISMLTYDEARQMTARQVVSLIQWDHSVLHALSGSDEFWNLTPRFLLEHRAKTKKDVKALAKIKRAEKRREAGPEMNVIASLGDLNAALDKLPKHAPDRRKAVIPGSKRSPYRKKVNGTVERRP